MNKAEVENETINALIKLGENKEDIIACIKNVNLRLEWNIDSVCLIYSRKSKKWFNGTIIDIFTHATTHQEWLVILYKKNTKKQIQRFNQCIKPINFSYEYKPIIIKFILKKFIENKIKPITSTLHSNQITDIKSIRLSNDIKSYHIRSIKYTDPSITCEYPYLNNFKDNNIMIQSIFDPYTIYFFNREHSFNYKYMINTKKWQTIAVVPKEHQLTYYSNCFYLDYKQGLIGVMCAKETKIRVYDEINDQWSCLEMTIKDNIAKDNESKESEEIKMCIDHAILVLDTTNNIYHFIDRNNHFTYNLNTFEFHRISDSAPQAVQVNRCKLIYNKYTHSFIALNDGTLCFHGMDHIYEYDIKNKKWIEKECKFSNFKPANWASKYKAFGYVYMNNLNKIITFGGGFGDGSDTWCWIESKYMFELDLCTKTWTALNIDKYFLSETFAVGAVFVEPFPTNDGYNIIHVLDEDWRENGSCHHVMMEIKGCNIKDKNEINQLYAAPNSMNMLPTIQHLTLVRSEDEKEDKNDMLLFDDIPKNSKSVSIIPIATDYRSKGIEFLEGTYNIKSITFSDDISRHNVEDCCIVQSVFDPNILYFFNADYKDYKYHLKTRKWKRIKIMDKKYQVTGCRGKNAFYLDEHKGLIGITGDWEIQDIVRIYNELTDEWSYQPLCEQKLNLKEHSDIDEKDFKFKIPYAAVALDAKNKIYHILTYHQHITYNLNTKEWIEMDDEGPHVEDWNHCLIYHQTSETLFYIGKFCFEWIYCYDIKAGKWTCIKTVKCVNFVTFDNRYSNFGAVHLNGLNKILTFGGDIGSKAVNYIFELDLNKKEWKLLDYKLPAMPHNMKILHAIPHNIGNGMHKIDILNNIWRGGRFGDTGQCVLVMYIEQTKSNVGNNDEKYAKYTIMPKRIEENKVT